ncbi:MAG TPA: PilZ domain-containing protein [Planctomycetota bacterium]|nr:PilZ domain-containing protein [Planctomycetota bacterium]
MNESDAPKPYRGRAHKARKARIKVDLWCEILGNRDRAVGHIRNLNVGGCRILSPSAFPLKDTVSLVLAGPAAGPDLTIKGQLRWLGLNPSEGPFELGVQFVHSGGTELQIERMLRQEMKRAPMVDERRVRVAVFTRDVETIQKPGAPNEVEVRRAVAAEGLDRLTRGSRS